MFAQIKNKKIGIEITVYSEENNIIKLIKFIYKILVIDILVIK
tara:strand:- start:386 stop:514 length:129 start_codon:yes stop_codon:yes gene_type:complete